MQNRILIGLLVAASAVMGGIVATKWQSEAQAQVNYDEENYQLSDAGGDYQLVEVIQDTSGVVGGKKQDHVYMVFDPSTGTLSTTYRIRVPSSYQILANPRGGCYVMNVQTGVTYSVDSRNAYRTVLEP